MTHVVTVPSRYPCAQGPDDNNNNNYSSPKENSVNFALGRQSFIALVSPASVNIPIVFKS